MKLNNKYYILRHGEAVSNVKQIVSSWPEKFDNPLTENGKNQIERAAEILKEKNIDLIFSSDLQRTKQTSEIVGKELNVRVNFDERLREISFGSTNGRPIEELVYLGLEKERLNHGFSESETYNDVLKRVSNFFLEINEKYKDKNILIVSHQCPLWILENYAKGFSLEEGLERNPEEKRMDRGELRELH